jgi:hypothetical protein
MKHAGIAVVIILAGLGFAGWRVFRPAQPPAETWEQAQRRAAKQAMPMPNPSYGRSPGWY